MHSFRNSVPARKIHGCYEDTQKLRVTFHSHIQVIQDDSSALMQTNHFKKLFNVFILYIHIQIIWHINYVAGKWFNQYLLGNK